MYGYPLILLPDVCELPVKRQRNGSRAARARASGKERLVPTSSRLILHLSRLMIAVSGRESGSLRLPGSSG